jgi:hypothetical protein
MKEKYKLETENTIKTENFPSFRKNWSCRHRRFLGPQTDKAIL